MQGERADRAATLVVACYNHERFLEKALATAFGQDHPDLRVIITDDASTDGSQRRIVELLEDHGWDADLILHEENRGICATFNEALAHVRTPYVAFISADDWQDRCRVSTHVRVLEGDREASMVYGPVVLVDEQGRGLDATFDDLYGGEWPGGQHEALFLRLLDYNWIPAASALCRTEALRAVGGFDESLPFEDYDMWLRLARVSSFAYCPDPLVIYRMVDGSLSRTLGTDSLDVATRLTLFGKHVGFSAQADAVLLPRMYVWAVSHYKNGGAFDDVSSVLRRLVKLRPSVKVLAFASLASLGIPWSTVAALTNRGRVRSEGR